MGTRGTIASLQNERHANTCAKYGYYEGVLKGVLLQTKGYYEGVLLLPVILRQMRTRVQKRGTMKGYYGGVLSSHRGLLARKPAH